MLLKSFAKENICPQRRNHWSLTALPTVGDAARVPGHGRTACKFVLLVVCREHISKKPGGSQTARRRGMVWPEGQGVRTVDQQDLPPHQVGQSSRAGDSRASDWTSRFAQGRLEKGWKSLQWVGEEGWEAEGFPAPCRQRVPGLVCAAQPQPGPTTPVASRCCCLAFARK